MEDMQKLSLSDVEWHIMNALWKLGEPTLSQVVEAVKESGWTKHAVFSFLKRLEGKGAVENDTSKRPSRYRAIIQKEAAIHQETKSILSRVFDGDLMLMMTSAVGSASLTEEEAQELIRLIEKAGE
jgi:BlaI family penicillinase repressor